MKTYDTFQAGLAQQTAAPFQKLAALRGVSSSIEFNTDTMRYVANGTDCGPSVHGLYDWLNKQPGVLP